MLEALQIQNTGVPIYIQLRDQIAAAVGRGTLAPGRQLPTMREVAVALKIDLNTVQRAYAELAREGIVTMVQGRGSFVADTPPPPQDRRAEIKALAARVAAQAQAAGISVRELAAALQKLSENTA